MKQQIEAALRPLIGQPLSNMWRPIWQTFEFGEQRPFINSKGKAVTRADYALDVHSPCTWRIIGPEGLIAGSGDYDQYDPETGEKVPAFNFDEPDMTPRDRRASAFFNLLADAPPIVETIEVDEIGGIRFQLTEGYVVEIIPDDDVS